RECRAIHRGLTPMLLSWLARRLDRPARPAKSKRRPGGRFLSSARRVVPVLLALEDRWLPATFHWANTVGGDFNDASNWRDPSGNPGVPGPNDDASVGFSGITVTSSQSNQVRSLNIPFSTATTLAVTGGSFTVT